MAALDRNELSDERLQPAAASRGRPLLRATPLEVESIQPVPSSRPTPETAPDKPQAPPVCRHAEPELPPEAATIIVTDDSPDGAIQGRQNSGNEGKFSTAAIRDFPPWLISGLFHMGMMIVLGLFMVGMQDQESRIFLDLGDVSPDEQLGDQLEFDSPLGMDSAEEIQEPILSLSDLLEVADPFASLAMLDVRPDGTLATSDIEAPRIGLALTGREDGSRRALLARYGGDATTEAAVDAGLQWLVRNQIKSGRDAGSWSLTGPFRDGAGPNDENPVAATAMALLAFQGRGNTHEKGQFRRNVASGWDWLLSQQDSEGNFFHAGPMDHRFYTQAQCTIALCELYGMTKDIEYKDPAERAIQYCLQWQAPAGGWRYNPGRESDLSVTGWVLMAMHSARMARLDIPKDNLYRAEAFLDSVVAKGGARYCYQPGKMPSLAMTAEGLLCRQYLGWPRDDPRLVKGIEWITRPENLIDFNSGRDVYYWYYATQAIHHMEGEYWKRWNAVMRRELPKQQVKRGREMGSWDPKVPTMDRFGYSAGRLYVTCLSIYMLEVYYRHLPIYTKIYADGS